MSRFYVGQRVRIKWAASHALETVGRETQIVGEGIGACGGEVWVTSLPEGTIGFWHCLKADAGCVFEPILDSMHEACDEDFKRDLDRLLDRQAVHS